MRSPIRERKSTLEKERRYQRTLLRRKRTTGIKQKYQKTANVLKSEAEFALDKLNRNKATEPWSPTT